MCYINLASAMSREHVTKTDISRILNIHLNTVTAKINCETASDTTRYQIGFTFLEALIIGFIHLSAPPSAAQSRSQI